MKVGTTIKQIPRREIKNLTFKIPPLNEQKRISQISQSFENLLNQESTYLKNLEQLKKGLLQALFPAEGDSVPQWRFPEFHNAGNWKKKSLTDCVSVYLGGTPETNMSEFWNGEIPWITPKDLSLKDNVLWIKDSKKKITERGRKRISKKLLPKNSIVLSTRAPIGLMAITLMDATINQGCKGLIPKEEVLSIFFFALLLRKKSILLDMGSGTSFKELSTKSLSQFELYLPDKDEQEKIACLLESFFVYIEAVRKKRNTLKLLKELI